MRYSLLVIRYRGLGTRWENLLGWETACEREELGNAGGLVGSKGFLCADLSRSPPVAAGRRKMELESATGRAALSIPANLAEGYGRFYYQDNARFCYDARGSLQEVLSHLRIAAEMHYIPAALSNELIEDGASLIKLINGYVAYLKRSKQGENEPGSQYAVHESSLRYDTGITGSPDPEASPSMDLDLIPSNE